MYERLKELGEESDSEYIVEAFDEVFGNKVVWLTGNEELTW